MGSAGREIGWCAGVALHQPQLRSRHPEGSASPPCFAWSPSPVPGEDWRLFRLDQPAGNGAPGVSLRHPRPVRHLVAEPGLLAPLGVAAGSRSSASASASASGALGEVEESWSPIASSSPTSRGEDQGRRWPAPPRAPPLDHPPPACAAIRRWSSRRDRPPARSIRCRRIDQRRRRPLPPAGERPP